MRSIPRRKSVVILLSLSAGLATGCLAPTLPPLPPPEAPNVTAPVDGEVEISGSLDVPRARVLVWNHDTGIIAGQAIEEYDYRFTIKAEAGHFLQLWYLSQGEQSDGVGVTVPEAASDAEPSDAEPSDAEPSDASAL